MSTLTLLPLVQVADGVQSNEDWRLSIAFYLDDGVTPIPLSGLSFSLSVGGVAVLTTAGGQIGIAGPSGNILVVAAPAAQIALWPLAVYPLSLAATDGVYTRDLFVNSTLTVGGAQIASVTLAVAPDNLARSVASPLPGALAAAFEALQPAQLAIALAALPRSTLVNLSQALIGALPLQTGASAPAVSGQAFVNNSGFVVIAQ